MPESSRETDAALTVALARGREIIARAPAGLLTDFDGTLSPIVSDPGAAGLVGGAAGPLATLADRLAVVAVVTGRSALDARRMTGVPGLLVAGSHGTEWLEPGATEPFTSAGAAAMRGGLESLLARVPDLPGVQVEDKGSNASVHYRNASDPSAARRAIVEALGPTERHGFRLGDGRMIVEVRPIGLGDKGSATRAIIERFALRGVIVMGDDVTDLDMFAVVAELRAAGELDALIVGVGGSDHEVPRAVVEAADVLLADPAQAAAMLDGLSR
jgi:trehalose 6-phosphate phosphatase